MNIAVLWYGFLLAFTGFAMYANYFQIEYFKIIVMADMGFFLGVLYTLILKYWGEL